MVKKMNEKQISKELISLATAVQTLYRKLYYLEINGKKDTIQYKETLDILKESVDIEANEYKKVITNNKVIDSLINIMQFIVKDKNLSYEINDKNLPLFRVYSRLFDITYDIGYQKKHYSEQERKLIEQYTEIDDFIVYQMQEDYQNRLYLKEQICGMLNKFAKITQKNFQTRDVIEQKYAYSYHLSFLEPLLLENSFNINNFSYPLLLKQADCLYIDEDEYKELKTNQILSEVSSTMMELLLKKRDRISYFTAKAYFMSMVDYLSLMDLDKLKALFLATVSNPLKGKKINQKVIFMIDKIISRAINKQIKEYGISLVLKKD